MNQKNNPVNPTITPHKIDNVTFCRYEMHDRNLSIILFNLVDMVFSFIGVISCFVHKDIYYFSLDK